MNKPTSRRDVLKWIGALGVGVVAGVGGDMILRPAPSVGPGLTTTATATPTKPTGKTYDKYVYVACPGGADHEECVLKVLTKGGKIWRTETPQLSGPEADWPSICARGLLAGRLPYIPNRVLYPLKRVGQRGEGKFERISWEQAISEIGQKLREIRDKYGPEAIGTYGWSCSTRPGTGIWNTLRPRFNNVFGATTVGVPAIDTSGFYAETIEFGNAFSGPLAQGFLSGYYRYDQRLFLDCKMIIPVGSDPIVSRAGPVARYIMAMKERGGKLVTVGRWFDQTAAASDWFIPVESGSDASLFLAVAKILIDEKLFDWDYVTKKTVLPFLVRDDNGQLLRESDIVKDGDKKKYVYWNHATKLPTSIAAFVYEYPWGEGPDLYYQGPVNKIACKTAFVRLKEHVAKFTPEYQQTLTGVPPGDVTKFAHMLMENRPFTFYHNWGYRYQTGGRAMRSVVLVATLSGTLGMHGGRIVMGSCAPQGCHDTFLNRDALIYPEGMAKAKGKSMIWRTVVQSAMGETQLPLKAAIYVNGNFAHSLPSTLIWRQYFKTLDLLVYMEYRNTDTTLWADYVLPHTTQFERDDIVYYPWQNHYVITEPAIQPLGESKTESDIWRLIAREVGMEQWFTKTQKEWVKAWFDESQKDPMTWAAKSAHPYAAQGITYEKIVAAGGMVRANVPDRRYDPFDEPEPSVGRMKAGQFSTESGRIQSYYEKLADIGEQFPTAGPEYQAIIRGGTPDTKLKADRSKYPLQFVGGRNRFFTQSQFWDVAQLNKLAGPPCAYMNPKDAVARGVNEGDVIELFNDRGSAKIKVHLSQMFPPGVVNAWYGWRMQDYPGGCKETLMYPHSWAETDDNISKKTGFMWDLLWDCAVEARKA